MWLQNATPSREQTKQLLRKVRIIRTEHAANICVMAGAFVVCVQTLNLRISVCQMASRMRLPQSFGSRKWSPNAISGRNQREGRWIVMSMTKQHFSGSNSVFATLLG